MRTQLADLKMPGALEALDDILRRADSGQLAARDAIGARLTSQIQLRNQRRLQTAMRSALAGREDAARSLFHVSALKREQLDNLHTLSFLDRRENVVFLGPPELATYYVTSLRRW